MWSRATRAAASVLRAERATTLPAHVGVWSAHAPATAAAARHMAKAKKTQQKKRGGPSQMSSAPVNAQMKAATEKHWQTLVAAITPAEIEPENLSAEDLAEFERRAKEYSRLKMAAHREWQRDITEKIRRKRAALAALPAGFLRDEAMKEDLELFPLKRRTPGMSPHIEGFYEDKQRAAEEAVGGAGGAGGGMGASSPSRAAAEGGRGNVL